MTGDGGSSRIMPMLRALAASPGGLSTTELARLCAADVTPWQNALNRVGITMRRQKALGLVGVAGVVPGSRPELRVVVWQITGEGRDLLASGRPRRPRDQQEKCLLALGALGEPTTTEVCDWLEAGPDPIGRGSAKVVLRQLTRLSPPLAEIAVRGRAGSGRPNRWRLTGAGRELAAAGLGDAVVRLRAAS